MRNPTQKEFEAAGVEAQELLGRMYELLGVTRSIDDQLALLLSQILSPGKDYGIAIYFAPNGAEIRFAIIDAVLLQLFRGEPHESEALAAWKILLAALTKLRKDRNTIAHGIPGVQIKNGKAYARIDGPALRLFAYKSNRPTGVSLSELKDMVANGHRCSYGVQAISQFIVSPTLSRSVDWPTLQKICLQLEAHLKNKSDLQFAPNLETPLTPPQSSAG